MRGKAERIRGVPTLLTGRYEPQAGIRRMKEIAELSALQKPRCKNAPETGFVLPEVDRRTGLIEEIGGQVPSNETLANVLWIAMGPGTGPTYLESSTSQKSCSRT